MRVLYLDTETYCPLDLRKTGASPYAQHPDFQVLMCAYSFDGHPARILIGHDQIKSKLADALQDPSVVKIAHNSQFDRVVLSSMLGLPDGQYLDPGQWDDTMPRAAEAGMPLKLEDLAKHLGVEEKDTAGTRLINLFSKPNRKGERTLPQDRPADWLDFIDYCVQDVDTLVQVDRTTPGWPTDFERRLWVVDQRINDTGMRADLPLSRWAVEQDTANRQQMSSRLQEILGIDNAGSVKQVTQGLQNLGLDLPNLRADTVREKLKDQNLTADQREALELRLEVSLVAARKYQAVINSACSDDRFRGGFRFFGAHTGRWSGSGVQLQNLPRAQMSDPRTAILDSRLGLGADPKTLKALVRSVFVGPFVVSDYSAIEARVLAWCAGEDWALDAFRNERDIYVETAERMGGLTRQQGKVAVLALGYQGGANSLRHMGAQGTEEELEALKTQWRRANRNIVRFWSDVGEAFYTGGTAGNIQVHKEGQNRLVYLPSGRPLTYRNVKKETWYFKDEQTGERVRKSGIRFSNSRGRADTYGGRLVENIVQAVSRDLLADLLVRLHEAGHKVVGHVHDEVIVEVSWDDAEQELRQIEEEMSKGPAWAQGLPLGAEGFVCQRYQKG